MYIFVFGDVVCEFALNNIDKDAFCLGEKYNRFVNIGSEVEVRGVFFKQPFTPFQRPPTSEPMLFEVYFVMKTQHPNYLLID